METPFKEHNAPQALSTGLGVDGALGEAWSLRCLSGVLGLQFLMARSGVSRSLPNPFSKYLVSWALLAPQIPLPGNRITSTAGQAAPGSRGQAASRPLALPSRPPAAYRLNVWGWWSPPRRGRGNKDKEGGQQSQRGDRQPLK